MRLINKKKFSAVSTAGVNERYICLALHLAMWKIVSFTSNLALSLLTLLRSCRPYHDIAGWIINFLLPMLHSWNISYAHLQKCSLGFSASHPKLLHKQYNLWYKHGPQTLLTISLHI